MTEDLALETLEIGEGAARRRIAYRRRAGAGPGLLWLNGFNSDMRGTKAEALDGWAAANGRACLRFDYSGTGEAPGAFEDGTISRWAEEAIAAFERLARGPTVVVGSSMGGWIGLLLARHLLGRAGPRVPGPALAGLVLVAPAPDFTERLMWAQFSGEVRREIEANGFWLRPTAYGAEPYKITRGLIEDGRRNLVMDAPISVGAPVRVLQGMRDEDVPFTHALDLVARLSDDDVVVTLIKDGDHRLSRPEDIERLIATIARIAD